MKNVIYHRNMDYVYVRHLASNDMLQVEPEDLWDLLDRAETWANRYYEDQAQNIQLNLFPDNIG